MVRAVERFIRSDALASFLVCLALFGHVRTLAGSCDFATRHASAAMSCEGSGAQHQSDRAPSKPLPTRLPDCPLTAGCGAAVVATTFVAETPIAGAARLAA